MEKGNGAIKSDILVVGTGIAGLSFAIKASKFADKVIVLCKKTKKDTNTNWAQGGIASVIDSEDSFQEHIDDTLRTCLLYTSPSPRDRTRSRMPSSA